MAHITPYGILYQTNKFRGFMKELGAEDKSRPVFEGRDIDNMTPGSILEFYCPLNCGEALLLPENTIESLDIVLDKHFKECRTKSKLEIEVGNAESLAPVVNSQVDDSLPLVFPDGQVGRCKVDPKTGQIIVTHMWMKRDDQLLEKLNELMNEFSWSAMVPKDRLKQMVVELHNPQTDFSYLAKEPKGFA